MIHEVKSEHVDYCLGKRGNTASTTPIDEVEYDKIAI